MVDDEVQRLSETKKYFKAKKAYAGVDWESIKDKYEIVKPLCQIYPNRQVVKNVHIQQTSSLETDSSKISKSFGCRTAKWRR